MVRPDVEPEYTYILRDEYQDNGGKGNKGDTSTWKVTAALLGLTLSTICLSPESKESIRIGVRYLPNRVVEAASDGISIVTAISFRRLAP